MGFCSLDQLQILQVNGENGTGRVGIQYKIRRLQGSAKALGAGVDGILELLVQAKK